MNLAAYQQQSIHILGYGLEGTTTTQFLIDQGVAPAQITIHDQKTDKHTPQGTTTRLGEQFGVGLKDADVIFRTAGIPLQYPILADIDHSNITSQAQLFFDHFPGKTIGITGSKGKSTTTVMIYEMLRDTGKKVLLVGNIGAGRLTDIIRDDPDCIAVCELSSGQLEGLTLSLDIGIFTNFYPIHHVGWHGSLEKYRDAKCKIVQSSDTLILGSQIVQTCPEIMKHITPESLIEYGPQGDYRFTDGLFKNSEGAVIGDDHQMQILGHHNRENACALFAVCDLLGIEKNIAQQTINSFKGLPHRLEILGVINGIRWINDAIATTPQATIAAIQTVGDDLGTIFLGGKDEGYKYAELCTVLNGHPTLQTILLFPDTHEVYLKQLNTERFSIHICQSMKEAVSIASQETEAGKTALLSCATSSFSLWMDGYRQKGEEFRREVSKIGN